MFERLTPPARQVMEQAGREAERLGHNYVGPEHILVSLAAELLAGLGIDLDAVREAVNDIFGTTTVEETARRVARHRPGRTPPWGWPPPGKGMVAKRALELAEAEADHQPAGPEHLLLGLLHDAQHPAKVPRCFKHPRARQVRTNRGWPQVDRPSPIPAMLRSQGLTIDTLRQAILAHVTAAT